jgi:hypothetical protein
MKPLRDILRVAFRWATAWAAGGAVLGVLLMLRKVVPFAESGAKPDSILGYWPWIPAMAAGGAAAGLGIGFLFACLMVWSADLRESYEAPGLVGRLGPFVLCGAAAGLIPGLLAGGITGALFFALLGACSAAALNWRVARAS